MHPRMSQLAPGGVGPGNYDVSMRSIEEMGKCRVFLAKNGGHLPRKREDVVFPMAE